MSDAFAVESDLLLKEIRLAKGFVNTRSHKPILQCIRLAVQHEEAKVTATDLEVSLTRSFPAYTQQQGGPTVFLYRSKPNARWIVAGHKEDTKPKAQAVAAAA